MIRAFALAAAILALPTIVAAQGAARPDPAKGQSIANQICVACHAADGNSELAANPKLAGQFPEYLHKQLANFKPAAGKKAERDNAVMAGMVANLSDADMRNVAAFYASQKLKPETAKNKMLVAQGQKLYRGGNLATGVAACAGCHGPDGAGIPSQYPRIGGQYAEYVEAQLKAFRSGARANDPNGMMRDVAAKMTEPEIKAVAEYVAGLR
ncbi:MAG: cytochrome C [Betaproteobacteria bacterium RIFCSPLOWO2_02_67_12]|nr:MAG: cytochrome C [Betaproteobacteria bacterium RIFCSPLOWO2_02_67_12]